MSVLYCLWAWCVISKRNMKYSAYCVKKLFLIENRLARNSRSSLVFVVIVVIIPFSNIISFSLYHLNSWSSLVFVVIVVIILFSLFIYHSLSYVIICYQIISTSMCTLNRFTSSKFLTWELNICTDECRGCCKKSSRTEWSQHQWYTFSAWYSPTHPPSLLLSLLIA